MQVTRARIALIVLLASTLHILLFASLYGLFRIAVPFHGVWPLWYSFVGEPLQAIAWLAPGLVVGWLAGRCGLWLGSLVGGLGAATEVFVFPHVWPAPIPDNLFSVVLVSGVIASSLYGAISGVAGQALRRRRLHQTVGPNGPLQISTV
jgi:hypothetical protein